MQEYSSTAPRYTRVPARILLHSSCICKNTPPQVLRLTHCTCKNTPPQLNLSDSHLPSRAQRPPQFLAFAFNNLAPPPPLLCGLLRGLSPLCVHLLPSRRTCQNENRSSAPHPHPPHPHHQNPLPSFLSCRLRMKTMRKRRRKRRRRNLSVSVFCCRLPRPHLHPPYLPFSVVLPLSFLFCD